MEHEIIEGINYVKKNGVFRIEDRLAPPVGMIRWILRDGKTGQIKDIQLTKNLFTEAGKEGLARHFRGVTDNNAGIVTYMAVGTSAIAPAPGDTGLTTEISRKLVSVRSNSGKTATFQTFFTTSEANGTLREAGLFGDDASSTPGSGRLYCKAAINRVKSSADTLTALWTVILG